MTEEVQGLYKSSNSKHEQNSQDFQSQAIHNCFHEDSNNESIKDENRDSLVRQDNFQKSKICFNKFCLTGQMNPNGKLIKMKIQGIFQNICQVCNAAYKKGQYCCYCEQIYQETGLNADVDGKDWIGCDTCEKWVHIECEEENGLHQIRKFQLKTGYEYSCQTCRQKRQNQFKKNKKLMGERQQFQKTRGRFESGNEDLEKIEDEALQLNNIYDHQFFRSSTFKKHLFSINEKKSSSTNETTVNNNLDVLFLQHSGRKLHLSEIEYENDLQILRQIQKRPFNPQIQETHIEKEKSISSQQESSENEECSKQKTKVQKNSTRIIKRKNNIQKGKKSDIKNNTKSEENGQKESNSYQNRQLRSKKI